MAPVPDPYRVLGLPRDATLDDVKRAYRRLAKEHHPDSGGERALPRFLQIQAAYEQLVGPAANGRTGRSGRPGPGARAPWEADDVRAEATRRAYGTRARRTTGRSRPPPPDPDDAARERPRRRGRPPNKATLGSTTYDGAEDEPFEPGWAGASWYGTTSGTYWTVNPREYADPRKHGPEYQARARRNRAAGEEPTPDPEVAPGADAATESRATPESGPAPRREPRARWSSTPEAGPDGSWSAAGDVGSTRPPSDSFDPGPGLSDLGRVLLRDPVTPPARLALALTGGAPLGLGLAWLLGELTGCGRFAATCDPGVVSLAWLAAAAIVVVLALVPALASVTSVGTVSLFLAGIPATVLLSVTGGARLPQASSATLGVILVIGWLAGVAYAVARRRRRSGPDGPVS